MVFSRYKIFNLVMDVVNLELEVIKLLSHLGRFHLITLALPLVTPPNHVVIATHLRVVLRNSGCIILSQDVLIFGVVIGKLVSIEDRNSLF